MHSFLTVAAFAALAAASPLNYRAIDWVTETDVTKTTDIVYVTVGGSSPVAAPSTTAAADTYVAAYTQSAGKHNHWSHTTAAASSAEATTLSTTLLESLTTPPAETAQETTSVAAAYTPATTSSEAAPVAVSSTSAAAPAYTTQAYSSAAPASSTTAEAATTAASSSGSTNTWATLHNAKRALHQDTGNVEWDEDLAANALAHSQQCVYQHSDGKGAYGENIAEGTNLDEADAFNMWYDEISSFTYGTNTVSETCMHFTQIVWKATTKIGCGIANCGAMNMVTCQYQTAGNVDGAYIENVAPLSS